MLEFFCFTYKKKDEFRTAFNNISNHDNFNLNINVIPDSKQTNT